MRFHLRSLVLLSVLLLACLGMQAESNSIYPKVKSEHDSLVALYPSPDEVREFAEAYYWRSLKTGDVNVQAFSLLLIAESYFSEKMNYDTVSIYLDKIYSILNRLDNDNLLNMIMYFSATMEMETGNEEKAIDYLRNCIHYGKSSNRKSLIDIYNTIGYTYARINMTDSANYYYELSAIEALHHMENPSFFIPFVNLIYSYISDSNYVKTKETIDYLYTLCSDNENEECLQCMRIAYGNYYRSIEKYDSARIWLYAAKNTDVYHKFCTQVSVVGSIIDLYDQMGLADSSVHYTEVRKALKDSLQGKEGEDRMDATLYSYSKLLDEARQKNLEQEITFNKQRTRSIIIISILGLVILIFASYIGITFLRRRLKIKEKEKEEANKKLIESYRKIRYKEESLNYYVSDILRRNEFMYALRNEINKMLKLEDPSLKSRLKEVSININAMLDIDENAKEILETTNTLTEAYYIKLQDKVPSISNKEKRLCVLIRLGLTQKEIASVLNISVNTVNSATYRLKKKFGLDKDTNFREYLEGLSK